MDRHTLDKLYSVSKAAPARIFNRALCEVPLQPDTYQFLLDHVDELDVDGLVTLFNTELAAEVESHEREFVRRLAQLVPSTDAGRLLRVLRLSARISPEAWLEDLTLPLRGQVPDHRWYRFIDKSRGGNIFNALNAGMPSNLGWDPDKMFVSSVEKEREPPVVVPLLERAHDDLAAAVFALETQPVAVLLELHQAFPDLIREDALKRVLLTRFASSESWTSADAARFPTWMAPFVAERLRQCGDHEARVLYEWLCAELGDTQDEVAFALALERFERAPMEEFWHPRIGRHLGTGASWKVRGRKLIDVCIEVGRGFPSGALRAALNAAKDDHGAEAQDHRLSILRKAHDETAKLFLERAERALKAGDYVVGDLFLSAFLSLDPGSFIGGVVRHLSKLTGLPPEIIERIAACAMLARAGGRDPSEESLYEAFAVLTGQLS